MPTSEAVQRFLKSAVTATCYDYFTRDHLFEMTGLIPFAGAGRGPSTLGSVFFICVLLNLGTDLTEDCDIFEHLEKLAGFIQRLLNSLGN